MKKNWKKTSTLGHQNASLKRRNIIRNKLNDIRQAQIETTNEDPFLTQASAKRKGGSIPEDGFGTYQYAIHHIFTIAKRKKITLANLPDFVNKTASKYYTK